MSDALPGTTRFAHRLQGRASLTAEAVCLARALEHLKPEDRRVVDDPYAELFLSGATRLGLRAWSGSFTGRVFRRLAPSSTSYVPLRHRFIDDGLTAALDAGAEQVVLLGAGYDTRAYRFAETLAGSEQMTGNLPGESHLEWTRNLRGDQPSAIDRRLDAKLAGPRRQDDLRGESTGGAPPAASSPRGGSTRAGRTRTRRA